MRHVQRSRAAFLVCLAAWVADGLAEWDLVWNDEFSGTSIDTSQWTHEENCDGGGNQEKQCYTASSDNSFVSNGVLTIKAMPATGQSLPYSSARLISKNKGDWTYGKFEARMKLPFGQGSWPAFWMLPTDNDYGIWPLSGEIDIMEAVNLKVGGERTLHGTLHYGNRWPNNRYSGTTYLLPNDANPADGYHTYAVEWEEGEIRWYVDGAHFQTQKRSTANYDSNGNPVSLKHRGWFHHVNGKPTYADSPFDKKFHLLLNLAVGGSWPENENDKGIDAAAFANGQFMHVDYVRVYQCNTSTSTGRGCATVASNYLSTTLLSGAASDLTPDSVVVPPSSSPPPAPPSTPSPPGSECAQWNNQACQSDNGECYTCGARIEYLISTGLPDAAAKSTVASDFPGECGGCSSSSIPPSSPPSSPTPSSPSPATSMPPSPSPATSIPPSSSPATSIPPSSSPATSILPSPSPVTPTPSPSSSSPVTPTPSPTSSTPAIPSSSSPSSSPATSKSPATSPPETPTPSSPSSSPATSKSPATSPPETPTPSSPSSLPATSMPPSSSPAASMPPSSLPAASMPPSSLPAASMPPSSSSPATPTPPSPPFPPRTTVAWQLVWSDEFSGTSIDSDKWTHEVNCDGGGNNEQQCYTMSSNNSWVSNGVLTIKAMPATGQALPYSSARLSSKNNGDWTYGKFEARMKLPSGQGSWPAFWMLPTDNEYGAWPLSGEIDIMEAVNLKAGGEGNIHGTLHYGNPWPHNKYSGSTYLLPHGANPADDFHTYTVEWEEGEIRWYVDGTHYQTQRRSTVAIDGNGNPVGLKHRGWFHEVDGKPTFANSPFDKNFYLLLNFAVGGDWPSNAHDRGIDAAAFANGQFMSIDYVRVYQCPADPATGKGCGTVASLIEGTAPDVLSNAAAQPVFHLLPAFVAALLTVLSWC